MHSDSSKSYSKKNSLLMEKGKLRRKLTSDIQLSFYIHIRHKLNTRPAGPGKITIIFPFIII